MSTSTTELYDAYSKKIYSSPFFDVSSFYMPTDFKQFFKWARFYFLTNQLIHPVIQQMSRYPVTSLTYNSKDNKTRELYKIMFEDILDIQKTMMALGLDYYTYGNAFAALQIPFNRILICPICKTRYDAKNIEYKYNYGKVEFKGTCQECKKQVAYIPKDEGVKLLKRFKISRYYPGDIEINYNYINGASQYQYIIPKMQEDAIKKNDKFQIETTPLIFLHAIAKRRRVILDSSKIFHFKRENISGMNMEWGVPILLPAMKKAFYLQILQKAQEAIAMQHIVPLTILFPQSSGGMNVYEMVDLGGWKDKIEEQIVKWKRDPNHITVMPFPVGSQPLFGQGRALLVTPEVREASIQVVAAMGVPQEFVFGGLSWSASSINLRMLENQFMSYRTMLKKFLVFIRNQLSTYLEIGKVEIDMKDFKMIDDVQQKEFIFRLAEAQKISDETLLDSIGRDAKEEMESLEKEWKTKVKRDKEKMIAQQEIQGELMVLQAKNQIKADIEAQKMREEELTKQQGAQVPQEQSGMPMDEAVDQWGQQLQGLAPEEQQRIMEQMNVEMPYLATELERRMANAGVKTQALAGSTAATPQPMPEQKPPRGKNRSV